MQPGDESDVRYGQQFLKATDAVFEAVAKFLGRENEYQEFVKKRDFLLQALDGNEEDTRYKHEDFVKSMPYWIRALEMPLINLYEQGLIDGAISSGKPTRQDQ